MLDETAHRTANVLARETLFVLACALAAWLLLNHDLFYLRDGFRPAPLPAAAYALTFLVIYVFVRGLVVLAQWRNPQVRDGADICPECGRAIDDGTPTGAHVMHQGPAAVARRAVSDARAALIAPTPAEDLIPTVSVMNRPHGEGRTAREMP